MLTLGASSVVGTTISATNSDISLLGGATIGQQNFLFDDFIVTNDSIVANPPFPALYGYQWATFLMSTGTSTGTSSTAASIDIVVDVYSSSGTIVSV
jgi:hypothetical protein